MQYAALWVTACIMVHSFAMDHEDGSNFAMDDFYIKGLGSCKQRNLLRRQSC